MVNRPDKSRDWAQFTFLVPTLFQIPASLELPNYSFNQDTLPWQLYRHLSDSSNPEQPSHIIGSCMGHAKLLRIIHDTLALFYHGHEATVSAKDVMMQYVRYIEWQDDLPDEVAMRDNSTQALPHVMAIQ